MGRESLVRTTSASNLAWDDNHEKSIDRVTALGIAAKENSMGVAVLHAEGLDEESLARTILLLARNMVKKSRCGMAYAKKIATAAMREHLMPKCRTCGGVQYDNARVATVCPSCRGTGLHRYTDTDRAQMAGIPRVTRLYTDALQMIRDSAANAARDASGRLTDQ